MVIPKVADVSEEDTANQDQADNVHKKMPCKMQKTCSIDYHFACVNQSPKLFFNV